ncbi:hypothetical protein ARMSODRAFT_954160 [Armillaria solidipes]|uniref:Uncharacterized protein n=1 Tax=Armillaria solidipes TaxID=1076256 RepID=A0A2H3BU27_9AGAR|nr:hypothetical protein ARMSODRAFT_954160 [Armillaria solidipes]
MALDPMSTPRPTHRRHSSSLSSRVTSHAHSTTELLDSSPSFQRYEGEFVTGSSSFRTQHQNTASRFMTSVKRSLAVSHGVTMKKRQPNVSKSGMYSTPEERSMPSSFRQRDLSSSPPTIEQIAMGLHLSRTPHLRPAGAQYHSPYGRTSAQGSQQHHHAQNETSRRTAPSVVLPPPPARSSLKKPGSTVSSANPGLSTASSTTVTSNCPSTPQSNRSLTSLKMRMSRFLPGARCVSAPSSVMGSPASSPRTSTSDILPRKKAVRFSTPALGIEEND